MATLTSFFLSESGFASPSKALSGSWISGIMVGAGSLLAPVTTSYADGGCVVEAGCAGYVAVVCCCGTGPADLTCYDNDWDCGCAS